MFIFHFEYFSSCKNFFKDDKKKYFLQNNLCFLKKLMEPHFSECLVLLKNRVTFQLLIYFIIKSVHVFLAQPVKQVPRKDLQVPSTG
jgi:hypothetical protein